MRTHYDLLDVGSDADDEALNKAYRKAAKAHHPDLNAADPDAARRFKQIAAAIEVLRDPGQRAAYDRWLDQKRQRQLERERQQRRLRRTRIIIADAIAAAAVIVVLAGGYVLIGPTFSTSALVSKVDNSVAPGPVATVAEQRTQRAESAGAEEPRRRLEQDLRVAAVSKQSAAEEREAASRPEPEERGQAAEFERQTAEREVTLSREQDERRQADEFERPTAEREGAPKREQDQRRQAAERERQKSEREAALREEHRAKRLAAMLEVARSAPSTPSQAVQGDQTVSSAASPRSFGPTEIAATRAFTRF
jgi:curved DNA-binding protein CbpA